jgi:hypothetical protein
LAQNGPKPGGFYYIRELDEPPKPPPLHVTNAGWIEVRMTQRVLLRVDAVQSSYCIRT